MFGFAESPAKYVSPRRDDAVIPRYCKEDEQKDAEKIPPKAWFVFFPYSILYKKVQKSGKIAVYFIRTFSKYRGTA